MTTVELLEWTKRWADSWYTNDYRTEILEELSKRLILSRKLAEFLCMTAGLLPSDCDADDGCKDGECLRCRAFELCAEYHAARDANGD